MSCSRYTRTVFRGAATFLLALGAAAVHAHSGVDAGRHHGLVSGLLHPMSGIDHLAAMFAVGLWSATSCVRRAWIAPLAFVLALLVGAWLAQAGLSFAALEPMIAASLLVVGLLLVVQARLPVFAGAVLVGGFALFHGAAHGQELAGKAALMGMVLATALLHLLGMAAGRALRERAVWLPRVAGVAVAATGAALGWSLQGV